MAMLRSRASSARRQGFLINANVAFYHRVESELLVKSSMALVPEFLSRCRIIGKLSQLVREIDFVPRPERDSAGTCDFMCCARIRDDEREGGVHRLKQNYAKGFVYRGKAEDVSWGLCG